MEKLCDLRVVVFDFGFTLWDEHRVWTDWAHWLRVSPLEFFAVLGSVIERGEHHHRAFEIVKPGFNIREEREKRRKAGQTEAFHPSELYPDVLPCLEALRKAGYRIGVAGNYFADYAKTLRGMGLPLDFIGSSEEWQVEKPSLAFFARVIREAGGRPEEIAYVGDRLDNDILPAKRAGLTGIFLRRGPWGLVHARRTEASEADLQIDSLGELPELL